ncbi:MAG: hypothetical protein Q8R92_05220 [Deltaproteobacteria bacterium]|nr:hypothetical protein [Deltaproteobacteria bacterium]
MKLQTDRTLNTIRGKNLVGKATKKDIDKLFEHLDALESFLDEQETSDCFGTEGWRHAAGAPE